MIWFLSVLALYYGFVCFVMRCAVYLFVLID